MISTTRYLERFCTPPVVTETEYDRKVLSGARMAELDFEEQRLICYSWGEGRPVLLVHGWGSKASHMALLARHIARAGFRAWVIDGPSHGRSLKDGPMQQSSMFEFARAVSAVTKTIEPLYALIGHSLGAMAALFASAGYGKLAPYEVKPERLVLISTPLSVEFVIDVYCQREGLDAEQKKVLTDELEQGFDFSVSSYCVMEALSRIQSELLIIHDKEDDEVPFSNAVTLHAARHGSRLLATNGNGHQRILVDRAVLRAVQAFLNESEN